MSDFHKKGVRKPPFSCAVKTQKIKKPPFNGGLTHVSLQQRKVLKFALSLCQINR